VLKALESAMEPLVALSTAWRSLELRNDISKAVRSAMASCSASDCGVSEL
jgi:hypothetical protein